jgi:hypothetical protein
MTKLIDKPVEISPELHSFIGLRAGQDCALRAILNESDELEIQFGKLYVVDNGKLSGYPKGFDSPYPWHMWCIDSEDNVYDCFNSIRDSLTYNSFSSKDPSQWKIKVVDGSKFDCRKNLMYGPDKYRVQFDKLYKGYDALYIYNYGFFPKIGTQTIYNSGVKSIQYESQLDWDMVEKRILKPIEDDLEKYNQLKSQPYSQMQLENMLKKAKNEDDSSISITQNKNGKFYIKVK